MGLYINLLIELQEVRVPENQVLAKLASIFINAANSWYNDCIDHEEFDDPQTWSDWCDAICEYHETDGWKEWIRQKVRNHRFPASEKDLSTWFASARRKRSKWQ